MIRALVLVLTFVAATNAVRAAEVSAFVSTAIKSVTDEILPPFERSSGTTIHALYSPPGALLKHFEAGEPADLFLTGADAIDRLIAEGKVAPGRVDLATVGIGICVKKGAPHPDVSTPEAFKAAMLAAKNVAYVAPSGGSVTGSHIEAMFKKLGIAEQMAAKTVFAAGGPNGRVSVKVSSGEAEIGLQQASELLTNPDVDVIGMLPGDLQQITVYSAGVTTSAKNAEGAKAIIAAMADPSARPIYKAKGMEPR
jgi:molybdate transport system substrate-binding protein